MRQILALMALVAMRTGLLCAQSQVYTQPEVGDTATLTHAFQHGVFRGHFRNFLMATDNARGLSDAWAWAAGGGLRYESKPFHRFSVGVGGFFIFNVASSPLGRRDSVTGAGNRYELGLFDATNPENRRDIDRLEALYIRYKARRWSLVLGKQVIHTPFINPQDGRMRPTTVDGAVLETRFRSGWTAQGAWLYGISPRGTVRWYKAAESLGVYGQGVQPNGMKSNYGGHLSSKGIGLLGLRRQYKRIQIQFWDQWVENIFNTALAQTDIVFGFDKARTPFSAGLQFIREDALRNGGNPDPQKAYIQPGESSWVLSGRLGYQMGRHWNFSAAATRMGGAGRFLAPREWGREPFYTFMPRERMEGLGRSAAWTGKATYAAYNNRLKISAALGRFNTGSLNPLRNKYGMPAYYQFNLEGAYFFGGPLKGFNINMLYVYKGAAGAVPENPVFIINKINMNHYNFVLNYHF